MQGCKLIFMYDEAFAQRYIDSYSFIPMALSKTPAALNLTTTEKGYFPHHSIDLKMQIMRVLTPTKSFTGMKTCRIKTRQSLMCGTARSLVNSSVSGRNCTRTG